MTQLQKIFRNYIESEEYETVYAISKKDREKLERLLDRKTYYEIEDVIYNTASEAEESGFMQGFKMAMSIRNECL